MFLFSVCFSISFEASQPLWRNVWFFRVFLLCYVESEIAIIGKQWERKQFYSSIITFVCENGPYLHLTRENIN